jgi:hypothetical protein
VSKRKTWLMVKRGLVIDPVHRERMGICVWLYLYMLDRADWETGIIPDWADSNEAEAMDMVLSTVRTQRRTLEELGYITCQQHKRHQSITILKWINPRTYNGEILNRKGEGFTTPLEIKGEGFTNSRVRVLLPIAASKDSTLTYRPQDHISTHKEEGADAPAPPRKKIAELMDHPAVIAYRNECLNTPNLEARKAIAQAVTDVSKWTETIRTFKVNRWNTHNIVNLIDAYQKGNGHDSNRRTSKQSPRPVTGSSVSDHQRADALALLGD